MSRVALDLGFIQIYWYSIMILIGLLVGLTIIYYEIKKQKINIDFFTNLAFYAIIIGIISARLYYVIFNWNYYSNNLLEIFEIWNGGLAIHGAIIGGGLFTLFYCYKHKVNIYRILDICVVGLIIAQAIGRWGNFFNQEAYGTLTTEKELLSLSIPRFIVDGMYINGGYHHPTFLYESLWNLFGFVILLIARRAIKYIKTGQLTGIYLVWYSLGRIFIESMRTDSLMLGDIKVAQLVSVLFIIAGIILIVIRNKGSRFDNLYRDGEKNEIRF
ncbi:MAG: prolipoprotein diacylglyceryl transferase [Bacilli bacterium]|nr:prolipoprotein diacylglyceryl transferase [Bacilli bacterium]